MSLPASPDHSSLRLGARAQRGVTLLELSFVLAALLALVAGLTYKTSDVFRKSRALDSASLLRLADDQLRQYVVAQGRLPCPDLDGDGIADTCTAGQQKGYLPYLTLGMVEKNYGFGEVPMLYGVFNHGAISLASTGQTFVPAYADESNNPVSLAYPRNVFDFCASLSQVIGGGHAAGALSMAGRYNVAFALGVPGKGNRDGQAAGWAGGPSVNAQYDGLNATHASQFELPEKALSLRYDDKTAYRSASDLFDHLRCASMNSSVGVLAEAVTFEYQTRDFAQGNFDSVRHGLNMNAAGTALAIWQVGQSIAGIASAVEVLTISSSLLATVSALCPLPPWVACAMIPVYATAVANASVGVGLSAGATAASVASLGLQITATVMYAQLKGRTSSPPADPVVDLSSVPAERVVALREAYQTSNAKARTAFADLPANPPDVNALNQSLNLRSGELDEKIGLVQEKAEDLGTLMRARLEGDTSTCASALPGCTARQVPTLDASGKITYDASGNIIYRTEYTRDNLGPTYGPGVKPALDSYGSALEQAGTVTGTGLPSSSDTVAFPSTTVVSPGEALVSANTLIGRYGSLLTATEVFDTKHLAWVAANAQVATFVPTNEATLSEYNAALEAREAAATARGDALANLRGEMGAGYSAWDYTAETSLCGGGADPCGWMRGGTPSTGSETALKTTQSVAFNQFVTARKAVADATAYAKAKQAADNLASQSWLDRNAYKTVLCATQATPVTWIGSTLVPSANPALWDASENLLAQPPTGLSCTGSASALDTSQDSAAAREAEREKYCVTPATRDETLCALYSGGEVTRSAIKGARPIVDALIQKGIVR